LQKEYFEKFRSTVQELTSRGDSINKAPIIACYISAGYTPNEALMIYETILRYHAIRQKIPFNIPLQKEYFDIFQFTVRQLTSSGNSIDKAPIIAFYILRGYTPNEAFMIYQNFKEQNIPFNIPLQKEYFDIFRFAVQELTSHGDDINKAPEMAFHEYMSRQTHRGGNKKSIKRKRNNKKKRTIRKNKNNKKKSVRRRRSNKSRCK